jgi:hypothetical protein
VTSDVPIVVERSMYWPITPASLERGQQRLRRHRDRAPWGLAEGASAVRTRFQTFILVANPDVAAT